MISDFRPLDITAAPLSDLIVNATPLYTQKLLLELNPAFWSQFISHVKTARKQLKTEPPVEPDADIRFITRAKR